MDSYKRTLLIKLWFEGYTLQRMSDHPCIMAPVAIVKATILELMLCGAIPTTGIGRE